MNEADYYRLLDTFLPSKEVREYLKEHPILPENVLLDIITGAPVPLSEKAKWAWGNVKHAIDDALSELTLRPGELFILADAWYDWDIREVKHSFTAPYLSFDNVIAHIHKELREYGADSFEQWYELEKWISADRGELVRKYKYILIGDQVSYFKKEYDMHFSCRVDPNLPVPFHAGDILTIDCRPFAPLKHALLIERGDNSDCCCLQALCIDEETGLMTAGAVKHRSLFGSGIYPIYTPIYNLSTFHGELPEEEKVLLTIQKELAGDEQSGRKLWNFMYRNRKTENEAETSRLINEYLKKTGNGRL